MTSAPAIFDRRQRRHRLARAARAAQPTDFLFERAIEDAFFRLSTIKRHFSDILDYGSPLPSFAEALHAQNNACVIRAAPALSLTGSQKLLRLVADGETVPFHTPQFDLIVSLFAMQDVNDLPGLLAQLTRTLKPDGLFLAAMLGGQSLNELRLCMVEAEEQICGGARPRVAPMIDVRDMGGLLQRAGLTLPVTDLDTCTVRYRDAVALLRDLQAMGAGHCLHAGAAPLRRDVLMRMAQIYATRFADADGKIRATFDILWASGWSPPAG